MPTHVFDVAYRVIPLFSIKVLAMGLVKGLVLRIAPSASPDVVSYNLRYEISVGDKVWNTGDYSLPPVDLGPPSPPAPDGKIEFDLGTYPELEGLDGVYDVGITAVDDAGNESNFLELEDASVDFTPPDAPSAPELVGG